MNVLTVVKAAFRRSKQFELCLLYVLVCTVHPWLNFRCDGITKLWL